MEYIINGYLNNYGFCIKKNNIDLTILCILKKYFSVKPELNYENDNIEEKDKYFDVYYQDDKYIVLPKFITNIIINVPKFNEKKNLIINENEYTSISFKINKYKYKCLTSNTKFNFNGKLRDYQEIIINEIFNKFGLDIKNPTNHKVSQTYPKGGIIKLSCGGGKCLGFNTPVLMYDGSIKMVQNIKVGEKIMGDDSKPRNILSITMGKELMYKICQENGDEYMVNSSHILSLYDPLMDEVIDISLEDYLCLENPNDLFGFKTTVEFYEKLIPFESYYFANWIFGESEKYLSYSDMVKIHYYIFSFKYKKTMPNDYIFNEDDYCIPDDYKYNSIKQRKLLMAGIFDSLSCIYENNQFIINIKNDVLRNDIIYIGRSIGLIVKINECDLIFSGSNLHILPFKKNYIGIRNDVKFSNIIYYKIEVIEKKIDNYYGFEIDGNKRFILGDFTVTHNTMLAIYLSWVLNQIFGIKTLVVTHKGFLMDQWEKRIKQYTTAKVGRIRQNKVDVEGKDIVIGMLRSLSIRDYSPEILHQFGLVIYDEVHHTGSRVDSQALLKTSAEYTIGLSATPDRVDGMTKVINWHIGDILYEMEKKYNYRVLVKKIFFRSSDKLFKEKKRYFQGRFAPNHTAMTNNLMLIKTRNQLIVNFIDVLKGMGRKILILSYRVDHLELLKNMVDNKIKADGETHIYNSYYYMGKTNRTEKDMAEKDGHIIFATMQLGEEGLDIPHLDTVIFALPVPIQKDKKKGKIKSSKTLIQSIGRILRNDKLEDLTQIPLVVDISDLFSIYSGWSNKRNEIYEKKNWYVQNFYWEDLEFLHQTKSIKETNDTETQKQNPMDMIFDDITDEDFIEKNLIISEEEAKLDNLSSSSSSSTSSSSSKSLEQYNLNTKNLTEPNIKSTKNKKELDIEEIIDSEPKITYGFGKKK